MYENNVECRVLTVAHVQHNIVSRYIYIQRYLTSSHTSDYYDAQYEWSAKNTQENEI